MNSISTYIVVNNTENNDYYDYASFLSNNVDFEFILSFWFLLFILSSVSLYDYINYQLKILTLTDIKFYCLFHLLFGFILTTLIDASFSECIRYSTLIVIITNLNRVLFYINPQNKILLVVGLAMIIYLSALLLQYYLIMKEYHHNILYLTNKVNELENSIKMYHNN
jgi:hypothetical protein